MSSITHRLTPPTRPNKNSQKLSGKDGPAKPAKGLAITYRRPEELTTTARILRTHSERQIDQIAASIERFGFLNPVLVDSSGKLIVGHGRARAAIKLVMAAIPVIQIEHLTKAEFRAYIIADNKLAELAGWDEGLLAIEFEYLQAAELDFDLTITGFETAEIDLIIENAKAPADELDQIPAMGSTQSVSQNGDAWILGPHRLICGDALAEGTYELLLEQKRADQVFTDPPYNVRINGHASVKRRSRHREFVMGSGEMDPEEFQRFLSTSFTLMRAHTADTALWYVCMDWRHIDVVSEASRHAKLDIKNLCVWVKDRPGMGSLYRSQHELVFVFQGGRGSHTNNVQLGRFGRNRSNVWQYPSAATFSKNGSEGDLAALHPTVKPVAMIADALLDCSKRGDVVLDPFLGSGSTLIAAEKVGRVCCGIELDPVYVDTAVRRWQAKTSQSAVHVQSGETFGALEKARSH